ncbi:VOC family protein [Methylobacterium aquaticum]|uniref:Glyoxalase n=1 Tax=Methylobacterium aquaticum TaxID=270351 RepID=A0A0J6SM72_9HYPH|nr:VOC family protein [Methylobacterium aquaticum]KMO36315.1 hypothetical protein VP06_10045 [Methylobacterium aquaticum]
MKYHPFGQAVGGISQIAYVVADIERSMKDFSDRLGMGPWFVSGPFVPPEGLYRGKPTDMRVTLAIAFAGHVMIELIQQHDDKPSVYREMIETRGYGFHHWGICSEDFDRDVERYVGADYPVAFSDRSPRGVRIAYVDATRDLPGMIEIIESSDRLQSIDMDYFAASQNWDGTDPVRRWP